MKSPRFLPAFAMLFAPFFALFLRTFAPRFAAVFALAFALFLPTAAAANDIEKSSAQIKSSIAQQQQLTKKLEDLAAEILAGEKALEQLDLQVQSAREQSEQLRAKSSEQSSELDAIVLQNKELLHNKSALEKQLIGLIATEFSYDLIAPKSLADSAQSVVNSEVLAALSSVLRNDLSRLGKNYSATIEQINAKQRQINQLNASIRQANERSRTLQGLLDRQKSLLSKQREDEAAYRKRLSALADEQKELQETLRKLKIVQEEKAAAEARKKALEAKKAAEKKAAEAAAKAAAAAAKKAAAAGQKPPPPAPKPVGKTAADAPLNVRHASELGYTGSVGKYRGAKLLSPLEKFSVKQRFGYYTDPVYKLKIFNENVVFKAAEVGANVRAVANGRVVYVGETPVLEKVVIIEHAGELHSIYAHLDKFSRLAKVGTRVMAGNVVGKVRSELTFELTQKNAHIDPLTAIKR